MGSTFPASPDNFTNPTGTDGLGDSIGGRTHSGMHADINDAMEAVQALLIGAPNVQTDDYTLALSDIGKVVELNKATGVVLTVPPAASVAFPVGTVINVYQAGAGNVSIAEGSGVTVRNLAALRGQYAEASLRYRGSDEWVLEGDLATAAGSVLTDYAEVLKTDGNISLTSTSMAAVSTSLDLTLTASSGDLVEFGLSGLLGAASNPNVVFDVYTLPSGTPVNPFSVGIGTGSGPQGVPGWESTINANERLQGSITRVLTADDVSGGETVLRLYYSKVASTARTLFAGTGIPLKVWAKNYGQV